MTGVLFDDQNRNGVRDAGEPGLAGLKVHGTKDVVTDAEGRYTITGVLHGSTADLWLPIAANGGKLTLSKPKDATGVAWISGWVYVEVGADPVTTHDFGYGRWGADQDVSFSWSDHGRDPSHVQVGDKMRVDAETTTGAAPGYGGVLITAPVGTHVVRRELAPGTAYDWLDSRHVRIYGLRHQDPKSNRMFPVDIVVDRPTRGNITVELTHDQNTDTNKSNNKASMAIVAKAKPAKHADQVVAPRHDSGTGTQTPQASSSKELAYTGVEPKPYLAAGVALLGVGAALVGVARRRPRRTEVKSS
ncbi:hypothetical protein [Labedaea rhizosphaerae]|uniref:hypothetical protein n=1 Tax=Labedaea rhizosphaerae TaxID=598644 RepID=UPI001061C118|nr:hypothetical protein [Labedaea rhizosphaerae]